MAKWSEFLELAHSYGGTAISEEVVVLELPVDASASTYHKVFMFYEVLKPDLEFVRLSSAVAELQRVDVAQVLREFGDLTVGGIQFNASDTGGLVCFGTSLPLRFIDLSETSIFMVYATVLARAAHNIARSTGFVG